MDIQASRPLLLDVSRMIWRRWTGRQPTGIDRACLAYFREFSDVTRAVVQRGGFTRVLGESQSAELTHLLGDQHHHESPRKLMALLVRAFARPASDRRSFRHATYLNIGHTGLNLPGHSRWVHATGVRPIYYVHDLIPVTHPQYCRAGEAERHGLRIATTLRLGQGIITNSEDSAIELRRFAVANDLPQPPMIVAPLGLSIDPQAPVGPAPLDEPYFLMIGTIEGRKNYGTILDVWERLIAERGRATPKLVIVGRRGWEADDVFARLDSDPRLRGHVLERSRVRDRELAAYLRHARALLFPSFVEGQGLPLSEALASGTSVIASDLAVFRETAADVPDYVQPTDTDGWLEHVLAYADDTSGSRAAQIARLRDYTPPSWEDHFKLVRGWAASVLG
jgi:glycosyltransferase involved in cell wall biosynthesis